MKTKMTVSQKICYGVGAFGKDLVYMLVTTFIMTYYNIVLGMNSAFVGSVLMAARLFDAFNDPIMGIVVAKTKTRFGKFRPWILAGTVLNGLTLYALFAVPDGMQMGNMKIYLAIVYVLWGVTYTLMDIPYWSMIPAMTEPGKERENITSLARSSAGIGDVIPTVLTMVMVPILGAGTAAANMKIGFKYWTLIITIVFVVSEIICVMNVKEREEVEVKSHGIKEMFQALLANDQAVVSVVTLVLVNSSLYLTSNLVIYYFTYDIKDITAYSIFNGFGGASQILAMMLFPLFRKRYQKKKLFVNAIVYELTGYILLLAMAVTGIVNHSYGVLPGWLLLFIPGFLIFMGSGLLNVLITIFLADSIDYGELKNGQREESVIFSMQTFVVKAASGVAVFLAGLAISIVSLDTTDGAVQSMGTLMGLRAIMTLIPCVGLLVGLFYFKKYYFLTEEKLEEITKELNEKRAQE